MRNVIARIRRKGENGMTTAEYAVGTVAACGFGGVLYQILKSDTVRGMVEKVLEQAFSVFGG
ncbi:DUF4244 domain-containing protein [Phytoactinopolyspora halotolerans]|uniref:DUF4244 domain-containing protein n=1 Tax=Phytoactinopolyspora halotolerans TaxID=1981512 RepID=A0A6L9S235_9ACTN|nr:DUF4244 domain-containing protein [Phytoactinopolyspora halotolerans]NED99132.1 DUF4244 domain-containing protein [Phytoactinopolyspora halotolerans]